MTATMDRRAAWVALGALVEPGNRELGVLIRRVGPVRALELVCSDHVSESLAGAVAARLDEDATVPAALALVDRLYADAARLGVRIKCPDDLDWPARFDDLARISRGYTGAPLDRDTDAPVCLWVRGALPLDETLHRSVAVVGARAATGYGAYVAGDLAYGLADRGWTVVSGGALGIDAAAHRGALAADGRTVAVLACGIDRPYPVSHTGLFEQIGETGLLVTEWPPGMPPYRLRFLVRNRLIAAAATGTVMVEAAQRSGARQTLHRARSLGRPTLVVPGPVTSAMSVGCHQELRVEGTRLVASVDEIVEEVGRIGDDLAPQPATPQRPHDRLDPLAAKVLDAVLPRKARTAEQVAAAAGVSGRDARRTLPSLAAMGFVVASTAGYRLPGRTTPPADDQEPPEPTDRPPSPADRPPARGNSTPGPTDRPPTPASGPPARGDNAPGPTDRPASGPPTLGDGTAPGPTDRPPTPASGPPTPGDRATAPSARGHDDGPGVGHRSPIQNAP